MYSWPEPPWCHDKDRLVIYHMDGSVEVYNLHDLVKGCEIDGKKVEVQERMKPRKFKLDEKEEIIHGTSENC